MVELRDIIPGLSSVERKVGSEAYEPPPAHLSVPDQAMHVYQNPARAGFNVFLHEGIAAIAAFRDNYAHEDTAEPLLSQPLQASHIDDLQGMHDEANNERSPLYYTSYCFAPKNRERFVADCAEAADIKRRIYEERGRVSPQEMRTIQTFEEYQRSIFRTTFEMQVAQPHMEKSADLTPDIVIPEVGYRATIPSYWDWHIDDRIMLSDRLEGIQNREMLRLQRLDAARAEEKFVNPEVERAANVFEWLCRQNKILFELYIKTSGDSSTS